METVRLIDANLASERIRGISKNMKKPAAVELACLVQIAAQETVDAVEVVRCKDCRHCKYQDEDDDRGDCDIHETWTTRTPESFCSFGERRPDDH